MVKRHSREEMLSVALEAALEGGLSRLTFGRLAARLKISDRTVVYYFPTKDDLVTSVLSVVGDRLQTVLAAAFSTPMRDHRALVATAWPVVAQPEYDPLFGLYFEAIGQATAGLEPYRSVASHLVEGWIEWLGGFVVGDAHHRRTEAAAAVAMLDGLLLMRLLGSSDLADTASTSLLDHRRIR
ncbi:MULTISPECIES: TetR/AcrR family transcriptional regulator [unclassified Rhodococcus (in: high G+C Gram-positive bacteria)]|uniref:TetR/AcrR family transcriptional regulator n=1 Tax=unclassified Rhodococcus (in: high G+C Gram-positive bacteria) TaxID=192944 RepID=UPI001179BF30|nr:MULTISPECIES: TetR/AcrR family transcriptional regulator [unclassified Rhodococcus (in: high G+C Gram-positive bacteria)]